MISKEKQENIVSLVKENFSDDIMVINDTIENISDSTDIPNNKLILWYEPFTLWLTVKFDSDWEDYWLLLGIYSSEYIKFNELDDWSLSIIYDAFITKSFILKDTKYKENSIIKTEQELKDFFKDVINKFYTNIGDKIEEKAELREKKEEEIRKEIEEELNEMEKETNEITDEIINSWKTNLTREEVYTIVKNRYNLLTENYDELGELSKFIKLEDEIHEKWDDYFLTDITCIFSYKNEIFSVTWTYNDWLETFKEDDIIVKFWLKPQKEIVIKYV